MASDHSIRASDQDRDVVVAVLRDAYTAGRLTLEEFDERTTAAYASRTWGELRKLTEDLPAQPVLGSDVPGGTCRRPPCPRTRPGRTDRRRRRCGTGAGRSRSSRWWRSGSCWRSPPGRPTRS